MSDDDKQLVDPDFDFDEVDDQPRRRKTDKLDEAKRKSKPTILHTLLYSDPEIVRDDGEEKVVRKISWKKVVSSSLFSFVVMWAVWCTISIFTLNEKTSVTAEKVVNMQSSVKEEIVERKEMDRVLHNRITKTDDFSRDQIRILQAALHDYRMATFDKVDNAKETLINMMIRILENQEDFKEKVEKVE